MPAESRPTKTLVAPLKLTKVTLRGLGPYLHGQELDIKPLTILCGENGSGKSTWLEALRLLKDTAGDVNFPMSDEWSPVVPWDKKDPAGYCTTYGSWIERVGTNSNLLSEYQGGTRLAAQRLADEAKERRNNFLDSRPDDLDLYGPAGSIGLELRVMREPTGDELPALTNPTDEVDPQNAAQQMLWSGRLTPGTNIRIRLARPIESYSNIVDGLQDLIELTLNDKFTIRLERSHEQDWSPLGKGSRKDERWILSCSGTFLPGHDDFQTELRQVAYLNRTTNEDSLTPLEIEAWCEANDESKEMIERLVANFCHLFKHLTRQTLAGLFPLGPIRELHQSEVCKMAPHITIRPGNKLDYEPATPENSISEDSNDEDDRPFERIRPDLRWVGERGENTQELFGYFAYNSMLQIGEPSMRYWLETFVSYWMTFLTETRVELADFPDGRPDEHALQSHCPLNGVMETSAWDWDRLAITFENVPNTEKAFTDFSRSLRPISSSLPAAWHVMSTGFHQVAPIVVQAGLLRQNEIMSVETPEAHLHPSLQIKLAEFLMHQANAGKIMLIETHSDLLVRRIMRAIIEDDVKILRNPQESVAIHFTRLKYTEDKSCKYATVEKLKVNENGRIVWPGDFMNDYIKESRRLMDAMYGTQTELDGDNDE